MALFIMGSAVTACGDDDDDEGYTFDTRAEQDAQGTYSGTFIRVQNGTTDTTRAEGTLTIAPTDVQSIAVVSFSSSDLAEMDTIAPIPVNISHANLGFTFYTTATSSTLSGRINEGPSLRATFSKAIRISARRTVRYNYEFISRSFGPTVIADQQ